MRQDPPGPGGWKVLEGCVRGFFLVEDFPLAPPTSAQIRPLPLPGPAQTQPKFCADTRQPGNQAAWTWVSIDTQWPQLTTKFIGGSFCLPK